MTEKSIRRHDLDALRAVAMLLGIGLHGALSFCPFPWPVQDTQQSQWFGWFFYAIHGFRMPLFFLISGFFTAMLWRRHGLRALIWHRFRRVCLPFLIGVFTIVPLVNWVSGVAIESAWEREAGKSLDSQAESEPSASPSRDANVWFASAIGDEDSVKEILDTGFDIDALNKDSGLCPLSMAALYGHFEVAELLVEQGADVSRKNRDGSTPLHHAAFLGHPRIATLLIKMGADRNAEMPDGSKPIQSAQANWEITEYFANLLSIELDREKVGNGRQDVIKLLTDSVGEQVQTETSDELTSEPIARAKELISKLTYTPMLGHLWFLWFLCWLVGGFAICALVIDAIGIKRLPKLFVVSPLNLTLLIPLTMLFQTRMGFGNPHFGPDTSLGLVPMWHVLFYYAIFFGFGAVYFFADDQKGSFGRFWWVGLPLCLLLSPLAIGISFNDVDVSNIVANRDQHAWIASLIQVLYVWLMASGSVGLFRAVLSKERSLVRYVSDSSYWLYLAHVPLVIWGQWLLRDWEFPALPKFLILCVVCSGILLLSYQFLVRYTWIGTMLNGRRARSANSPHAAHVAQENPSGAEQQGNKEDEKRRGR